MRTEREPAALTLAARPEVSRGRGLVAITASQGAFWCRVSPRFGRDRGSAQRGDQGSGNPRSLAASAAVFVHLQHLRACQSPTRPKREDGPRSSPS